MKDIDPNLRIRASLKNGVEEKTGVEAFIVALRDCIETSIGENPDDPERGTHIPEYLKESVSPFNSIVIEDIVKNVARNYMKDYDIDISRISVVPDQINNEYVVNVPIRENSMAERNRNLEIVLEIVR